MQCSGPCDPILFLHPKQAAITAKGQSQKHAKAIVMHTQHASTQPPPARPRRSHSFSIAQRTSRRCLYLQRVDLARSPQMLQKTRSEEHTSELQSLMRISYAVFCLKKKKITKQYHNYN